MGKFLIKNCLSKIKVPSHNLPKFKYSNNSMLYHKMKLGFKLKKKDLSKNNYCNSCYEYPMEV